MPTLLLQHIPEIIGGAIAAFLGLYLGYTIWCVYFVKKGYWEKKFWWHDFWYAFPFFGGIHQAVRMKNLHKRPDGLTAAEDKLMSGYGKYLKYATRLEFDRAYRFLTLAKQQDRLLDVPIALKLFLSGLLFAEAFGYGVLITPSLGTMMTPLETDIGAPFVAAVIAGVSAFLVHRAGRQLYYIIQVKDVRREAAQEEVSVFSKAVAIDADQDEADGREADATRYGNRMLDTKSSRRRYALVIAAIGWVIFIGVTGFWIRDQGAYKSLLDAERSGSGNPFQNMNLPTVIQHGASHVLHSLDNSIAHAVLFEHLGGIVALTAIFVFTQIVAAAAGYMYGLPPQNRLKEAFAVTHGHGSYDAYNREWLEPMVDRVDDRLRYLREHLFHDTREKPDLTITFDTWLTRKVRKSLQEQIQRDGHQRDGAALRSASASSSPGQAPEPAVTTGGSAPPAEWLTWIDWIFEAEAGDPRTAAIVAAMRKIPDANGREKFKALIQNEKRLREAAVPVAEESWMKDV